MMCRCTLIISMLLFAFAAAAQDRLSVRGTIEDMPQGRAYIIAKEDTVAVVDIVDFQFQMECDVPDVQVAYMAVEGIDDWLPFFPEAGEFTAMLDTDMPEQNMFATNSRIYGGAKQTLYNEWDARYHDLIIRFFMEFVLPYERAEAEGDMVRARELEESYKAGLEKDFEELLRWFVSENPASDVATYVVYTQDGMMFEMLSMEQQQSPLGRETASIIERNATIEAAAMQEGEKAPVDIPLDLPDGSTITVGSIDARLKVLVFWATSCPPCIQSIEPMRKIYDEWHDKGVEMVWVFTWSNSRDEWLAALEKFDMPWINAFEENIGKPLERKLSIRALPYKLVLDTDNNVIAVNPSILLLHELINNYLKL